MDTKLPFDPAKLIGISEKTMMIHADKLYQGYVKKKKEIQDKVAALSADDLTAANPHHSVLRELKQEETWAVNGVYLHEFYFAALGKASQPTGSLVDAISQTWGFEKFGLLFTACGMSARGWVILGWDMRDGALRIYNADAHNQGGIWGVVPLLVLDVYEHAYFIDFGADRKAYIQSWWQNVSWDVPTKLYEQVKNMKIDLPV